MNQIILAAQYAQKCHDGEIRKYGESPDPYIYHPARVAGRFCLLPDATEEGVMTSWLHDVEEHTRELDPKTTLMPELVERFGTQVATYVEWLTNPSIRTTGMSRSKRKAMDRDHLSQAPTIIKRIKMLDSIDNLRGLDEAPRTFRILYMGETKLLLEAIGDADKTLAEELIFLAERAAILK